MSAIKKIVVPTDFSAASKAALSYACGLAADLNASLCVLHTVEHPYSIGAVTEYYGLSQELFERYERESRKSLHAVLSSEEQATYRASLVLLKGDAAQEILRYLQEHDDVGLVVMATQGRGGVARLMMGSVADTVVRAARCPVLTIRVDDDSPTTTRRTA